MTIEVGEPIPLVTASAVLRNRDSFSMRGVYTQHQRFDHGQHGDLFHFLQLNAAALVLGYTIQTVTSSHPHCSEDNAYPFLIDGHRLEGGMPPDDLAGYTILMFIGNVHLVAGRSEHLEHVLAVLSKGGIETSGNPDLYVRQFGSFGIDEARDLSAKAAMRAVSGERRYFVLAVDVITSEAQNALLKTLEDVPGDAMFIFIHPSPQTLLSTMRSRAQILDIGVRKDDGAMINAAQFLQATPAKRLDMLKPILEKGDDDPVKPGGHGTGKRDFGAILSFLAVLERELAHGIKGEKGKKGEGGLQAVYRARRYIGDRGA